jgi:hypothetical protein
MRAGAFCVSSSSPFSRSKGRASGRERKARFLRGNRAFLFSGVRVGRVNEGMARTNGNQEGADARAGRARGRERVIEGPRIDGSTTGEAAAVIAEAIALLFDERTERLSTRRTMRLPGVRLCPRRAGAGETPVHTDDDRQYPLTDSETPTVPAR